MKSKLELFYIEHKIPVEKTTQVLSSRHRLKPLAVENAIEDYYRDVSDRKINLPSIEIGWEGLRRAKGIELKKFQEDRANTSKLRQEIKDLNQKIEWLRTPWYKKMAWRMNK